MHMSMTVFTVLLTACHFMGAQSESPDKDFRVSQQSNQSSEIESLFMVGKEWARAIKRNDVQAIIDLAELPETKHALRESLSNPGDVLAQYLFFGKNSVKAFLLKHKNLDQKIVRYGRSDTYYVCFYDPSRFSGDWSLNHLDNYALDLKTVVCESFYVVNGKWYMDFNMPIFTED